MSALAPQFDGRVNFTIVSAEETAKSADDLALYGFTEAKHGLVGLGSNGEAVVKIPGHNINPDALGEMVKSLLASSAL